MIHPVDRRRLQLATTGISCHDSALSPELDGRVGIHRAGGSAGLQAKGKDVVELEIGDSPFPSDAAREAGGDPAIEDNETGYCPSLGLPEFPRGGGSGSSRPSLATR